jgi:hypothetical protein
MGRWNPERHSPSSSPLQCCVYPHPRAGTMNPTTVQITARGTLLSSPPHRTAVVPARCQLFRPVGLPSEQGAKAKDPEADIKLRVPCGLRLAGPRGRSIRRTNSAAEPEQWDRGMKKRALRLPFGTGLGGIRRVVWAAGRECVVVWALPRRIEHFLGVE